MENQHRKIKGYRELSQTEIDLMNQIKAKGLDLENLIAQVRNHLDSQAIQARADQEQDGGEELKRISAAEPQRWASLAKTHFQEGLMALTRSVAQPTFF